MADSTTTRHWSTYENDLKKVAGQMDALCKSYFTDPQLPQRLLSVLGPKMMEPCMRALQKGVADPGAYMLDMVSKRMRPVLMHLLMQSLGGDTRRYGAIPLWPEILHNATLVRDDMEDHSTERRGKPCLHVVSGDTRANGFADVGYFWPMQDLVENNPNVSEENKAALRKIFIAGMNRLTIGQVLDLEWGQDTVPIETLTTEDITYMLYGKNGALMEMVAKMAAVLSGAPESTADAVAEFCRQLGIAHQLHDDVINIAKDSEITPDKWGEDISEGKKTYLVAYTMQHADEDKKKRLKEILAAHTKEKATIREAVDIIEGSGAFEYARSEERGIIDEAWANVDSVFKDSDAKKMLRFLAEYTIARKK